MNTAVIERSSRSREDLLTASRPPVLRLALIEVRKLLDTPSGIVLLSVGALLAGIFGGGYVLFRGEQATFTDVAIMAGMPGGILATVLAILLVTSEQSQRTVLATFALTPRRERIVAAKAIAVVAMGIAVVLLAMIAAAMIVPLGGSLTGHEVAWDFDVVQLTWFGVGTVVGALSGFALGLAVGNAPAAIVVVLVWPMLTSLLQNVSRVGEFLAWIDVAAAARLADGATAVEIAQFCSGVVVWVLLPTLIGLARVLRSEVR